MTGPRAVPTNRHFRLESLAPGVYATIARPRGYALCNSGIVDLGGATVVFDSMLTPMAAQVLARTATRLTGRPPDWVVNSHWHGDHIWGNSAFSGAHVVSTHRTRREIRRRSRAQLVECRREFPRELRALSRPGSTVPRRERPGLRGWFEGVLAMPRSHRIVLPDVTFVDELVLEGSRRALHLLSYGGGHSPSDVLGYLPDERIVLAGDLTMVGMHPSVSDGWTDRWIHILERIDRLRPDRILPGHGVPGTRRDLAIEIRYLGELDRIVARARREGRSLADLRKTPIPSAYSEWTFSVMFPDNLSRVYRLARRAGAGPGRGR